MKRILCVILVLVMMLSLFPAGFAEEETIYEDEDPVVLDEIEQPDDEGIIPEEENDPDYVPVSLEGYIDLTEDKSSEGVVLDGRSGFITAQALTETAYVVSSVTGSCGPNTYYNKTTYSDGTVELIISGTGAVTSSPWMEDNDVTHISVQNGVTSLPFHAFSHSHYSYSPNNYSLKEVEIADSVTQIGHSSFELCLGLESVILSNSLKEISDASFRGCISLKSFSLPGGVTTIGSSSFSSCTALKTLVIPSSVKTIKEDAFSNIGDLTLEFRGDAPSFAENAFEYSTIKAEAPGNSTWTSSVMQNYEGTVTWSQPPYVTSVRKPTGTLPYGKAFTLKGVIWPGTGTFSKVGALVYLASDTSYSSSKTGKQISYTGTKKYSIEGSTLDTSCKFGSLSPGSYVYIITATVDGKKYIVSKSNFTIETPTYTVSYDGNGSTTNVPAKQTKTYNVDLKLSTKVPTLEDYEFLGWAASKTASEATYQPGDTYKANKNITLYAVWKKTCYSLYTYLNFSGKNYLVDTDFSGDLNEYFWSSRDTSVATIEIDREERYEGYNSLRIDNSSPGMKAGKKDLLFRTTTHENTEYGYVGDSKNMILSFWAKSSSAGTMMYFRWGYEDVFRSVTLTTDWVKYSVCMDKTTDMSMCIHPYVDRAGTVWLAELQLEDGTSATEFVPETGGAYLTMDASIGSTYTLPSEPSRPGYTFLGWYTAAAGGSQITGSTSVITGSINAYAHWSGPAYSRSFTVSFDPNEGNCATAEKVVTYHGTYGELPVPYRTGDRFLGWYLYTNSTEDDILITANSTVNTPEDHTLFADWERLNLYTLPSSITCVEDEAFAGCAAEYVLVPENILRIENHAFASCEYLKVVEFQTASVEIADDAFQYCVDLTIIAPSGGSVEAFAQENQLTFAAK